MATHQVIRADLTEIVFEHREKAYGAYQNRQKYNQSLMVALLLTLSGFTIAVAAPKVWTLMMLDGPSPKKAAIIADEHILEKYLPPPDKKVVVPVVPVRRQRPAAPRADVIRFQVPDPKPDNEVMVEDTVPEQREFDKAQVGLVTSTGDSAYNDYYIPEDTGTGTTGLFVEEEIPGPEKFIHVTREPSAINMDDIRKSIGYPRDAVEVGIQGKVIVRVLVGKDGSYVEHRVISAAHPILKKAVEEKIGNLTFIPGLQGNNPIYVWVNIPFHFFLN